MKHFACSCAVFLIACGAVAPVSTTAGAGPVAGARSCGHFANRAPSTVGRGGSSTVDMAIAVKEVGALSDAVICLINAERTQAGLKPLTRNKQLTAAAMKLTGEAQRDKWWGAGANPHVNPKTGESIDARIRSAGYCGGAPRATGEIAFTWAGQGSPDVPGGARPRGAVDWWMNRSKIEVGGNHRELILSEGFKEIGVGISGQVADRSIPPQPLMGTYVVDFGGC